MDVSKPISVGMDPDKPMVPNSSLVTADPEHVTPYLWTSNHIQPGGVS